MPAIACLRTRFATLWQPVSRATRSTRAATPHAFIAILTVMTWIGPTAAAPPTPSTELEEGEEVKVFDGKSLEGWRILEKFDFDDHGAISVNDGVIRLEKGKPQTGISWKGEFPRSNYRIRFEGRRVDGSDFFCGLTFPVKDDYCTLILGGWGGQVVGLSNIDGFSAVENNTTQAFDFQKDRWYRIELTVTDDRIQAKIDDETIINHKTEGHTFSIWWEQEPVRPLGIVTYGTTGELKNLKIVRVQAKQP